MCFGTNSFTGKAFEPRQRSNPNPERKNASDMDSLRLNPQASGTSSGTHCKSLRQRPAHQKVSEDGNRSGDEGKRSIP